ncbi:MAG: hypothetical protein ACLQBX_11755 [Candidatus Limnocylindrales bacterium]
MKVEIVSNFEDPAGFVAGTIATGEDGTLTTTGEGQAILTEFPVLSDPDTHGGAVRPSDGDAYLQALLSTLPDGYVFARVAGSVTPEVIPLGSTGDTSE